MTSKAPIAWACLDLARLPGTETRLGPDGLEAAVEAAAAASHQAFECSGRHEWSPQGLSAWRLGRGRIVLHTWPELGRATLDLWAEQPLLDAMERAVRMALRERSWFVRSRCAARPWGP